MVFISRLYFFFIRGIKSLRTRRFSASVPCVFMKYGKDLPEKLSCRYITHTYPEYASVRSVQSIWISVRGFFTSRSGAGARFGVGSLLRRNEGIQWCSGPLV